MAMIHDDTPNNRQKTADAIMPLLCAAGDRASGFEVMREITERAFVALGVPIDAKEIDQIAADAIRHMPESAERH
jgi:hypothetical protein